MNVGGLVLLRFLGSLRLSAEAQAAYAVSYVELLSLITWTSLGLMGATAAVAGRNQGTGDTKSPLYISIVSQLMVPLGMCAIIQALRGLEPGDIRLAIVLGHLTRATLSVLRFRQEKWRTIRVDIGPAKA